MKKIKPCPFCGGEGDLLPQPDGIIAIICKQCQTKVFDVTEFNEDVINRWNRRIPETFTIEEFRKYLFTCDSRGDIMYYLSAEKIRNANEEIDEDNDE